MKNVRICVIVTMLLGFRVQAQVHTGSLVVYILSGNSDYVVIGSESHDTKMIRGIRDPGGDDRSCKIISLGGDTIFFNTGSVLIGAYRGNTWDSKRTARSVFKSAQKRDAVSLSLAWGNKALSWFYTQSLQDLQTIAYGPHGSIVSGGFINFDKNGKLFIQAVEISFNASKRALTFQPTSQAPGQIGAAGIGLSLVEEFFSGKTNRAVQAFGPQGMVRLIAVDATLDVGLVRKAIRFTMDNVTGQEKMALGGDIDIAIIRKNGTIEWISRKPWCAQQDQKITHLSKHR